MGADNSDGEDFAEAALSNGVVYCHPEDAHLLESIPVKVRASPFLEKGKLITLKMPSLEVSGFGLGLFASDEDE